jgi:cytochrome b6-f complex iron-sulfur subunit
MQFDEPRPRIARRRLLELGVTGLLLLPVVVPLTFVAGVLVRAGRRRRPDLVPALPLSEIPEQGVRRFRLQYRRRHGAFVEKVNRIVFLRRRGREVIALSAECTHLGCNVTFDAATEKLLCPCHKGVFTLDGSVESGPPPAPLRRFAVEMPEEPDAPIRLRI